MPYIGRDTDKISNVEVLDNITFDGSSSYTLQKGGSNFTPSSANTLLLSIDGVVQAGNFTVSGSTIDFGTAVAGTSTCDFILHYGIGLITTPSDGTVTTAKLADSSVSLAKLTATGTKDATTFLRGDNTFAAAGGGKVLQVVFGSTSTETRNSTNNLADTNLSASITPSATNSKVLIIVMQNGCDKTNANAGNQMIIKLLRGSTQISTLTNNGGYSNSSIPLSFGTVGGCLLDEPNSTSSLTYKTQFSCGNNTAGVGVQGTGGENSHITLMEIGA